MFLKYFYRRKKARMEKLHLDDDIVDFLENEFDKFELPLITRIQYITDAAQISESAVRKWILHKNFNQ